MVHVITKMTSLIHSKILILITKEQITVHYIIIT